jgi:phenylalanyl-tRNA synthetase alpha chain
MQDTFFVSRAADPRRSTLLRTHTSTIQVREMSRRQPPLAIVAPGTVYRRDDDATHSPMFHQIEGFLVDTDVSFADLKGVLSVFAKRLFHAEAEVRFRPSYFPFVEPGGEMDVSCAICRAWEKDAARTAACRVCKGTGFLEVLGCGMIHPVVFEAVGYDPERYSGFAFGMGLDRIAMLKYGIPNIKLLYENDVRFLAGF